MSQMSSLEKLRRTGLGVALSCRAFVPSDLYAGCLLEVRPAGLEARADYYLARKRPHHQEER